MKHFERADTTDNISMAKFSDSDEESDTKRHKSVPKSSRSVSATVKKVVKKNSLLYCSLHGQNISHTSRECKFLKATAEKKDKPKYGKIIKKKFKDLNLLQAESANQKSKYEQLKKLSRKRILPRRRLLF